MGLVGVYNECLGGTVQYQESLSARIYVMFKAWKCSPGPSWYVAVHNTETDPTPCLDFYIGLSHRDAYDRRMFYRGVLDRCQGLYILAQVHHEQITFSRMQVAPLDTDSTQHEHRTAAFTTHTRQHIAGLQHRSSCLRPRQQHIIKALFTGPAVPTLQHC